MGKIRVLDNVYDLITINMADRFKDNVAFRFYDTANDAVTAILYKDYVQDIHKVVNYPHHRESWRLPFGIERR